MPIYLLPVIIVAFVLQSSFCKSFSDSCPGKEAQSTPVFAAAFGLSIGLASWAIGGFPLTFSLPTVFCGVANGVALFLYNLSMIRAGQRGSYSFMMICMLFGGTISPLLHSVFFLNGSLKSAQWVGIALMCVAFVVMNLKGLNLKGSSRSYLLWCALLFVSNGAYTILNNQQQTMMQHTERSQMLLLAYGISGLIAVVYHLITRKGKMLSDYILPGRSILYLVISCATAILAANLLFYLFRFMDAPILYTIVNGGIIAGSALYAFLFFKERPSKSQLVGILLALVSIVLLSI